ncbi:YceI family protein [Maribacter sp. 2304DJ31-5]|uniref:YceI family protein n=1 Tax=Maribacter sp. 2304DJ31-5 TaxID=3386273 RepID=UPI0039BD73BE
MRRIVSLLFVIILTQFMWSQTPVAIKSGAVTFNFVEKNVNGSISGFTSKSKIDWNNLERAVIEGSVATETLKTGNFLRDWSLKGGKYFDANDYPKIYFKSTSVQLKESDVLVTGNLTIKTITKPIHIKFQKKGNSLRGTTTLFSSDFGITVLKKGRESNKVSVEFDLILQ